jgi:hypothetical protein
MTMIAAVPIARTRNVPLPGNDALPCVMLLCRHLLLACLLAVVVLLLLPSSCCLGGISHHIMIIQYNTLRYVTSPLQVRYSSTKQTCNMQSNTRTHTRPNLLCSRSNHATNVPFASLLFISLRFFSFASLLCFRSYSLYS